MPADAIVGLDVKAQASAPARRIEASYRRPYQMHGAIGPSCAIALMKDATLTVWTQSADPITKQFQTETKALLNVSPRNVFFTWEFAGLGYMNRIQPTPPAIAALLP